MNSLAKNSLAITLFCSSLVIAPSCSLMQPSTQSVSVTATDNTAELSADGQVIGVGAATVNLARNKSHSFMAKTPDGRIAIASVGRSMSSTGILDIVGGFVFLVPFIGLLGPGAWDLDSTTVTLGVPPKQN